MKKTARKSSRKKPQYDMKKILEEIYDAVSKSKPEESETVDPLSQKIDVLTKRLDDLMHRIAKIEKQLKDDDLEIFKKIAEQEEKKPKKEPFEPYRPYPVKPWKTPKPWPDPFYPDTDPWDQTEKAQAGCSQCGIKWSGSFGYVCPNSNCPNRVIVQCGTSTTNATTATKGYTNAELAEKLEASDRCACGQNTICQCNKL